MSYAIITVGGKQYRVREGERLLVDRLALEDGATFTPDRAARRRRRRAAARPGGRRRSPRRCSAQAKGPKIRIGKYKKRTGYKRHTGFRASLTQIQIESIGGGRPTREAEGEARRSQAAEAAADEAAAPSGLPERVRGPDGRRDQGGGADLGRRGARGRARVRAGARQAQGRDRRARVRASPEGESLDGTQEGSRLLAERPRLQSRSDSA